MTTDLGPVQFVAIGFDAPKFGGDIAEELRRLKQQGVVRVLDALIVFKDGGGNVRKMQVGDLDLDDTKWFGEKIGNLIGAESADTVDSSSATEEVAAPRSSASVEPSVHIFYGDEWDVLESIPNNTAAALVLLDHQWAIPLRKAVMAEGGIAIGDLWLQPADLISIGLLSTNGDQDMERKAS